MEKQKKWQFFLILAVIALTIYHILPTVFYYSRSLKSPIVESQAKEISKTISNRVSTIESDSINWLHSFASLLNIKPQSIKKEGQTFVVSFTKSDEAAQFRKLLPRAGSLIQFIPAQLGLAPHEESSKEVVVQRRIPLNLDESMFTFAPKDSAPYRQFILDRASQIAYALTGEHVAKESIHIGSKNPVFSEVFVDWEKEQIVLKLHKTIDPSKLEQSVINEVAKVSQMTHETLDAKDSTYVAPLHKMANPSGFLLLDLALIGKAQEEQILSAIKADFHPTHVDLQGLNIVNEKEYRRLSTPDQALSLVVHAPNKTDPTFHISFNGLDALIKTYEEQPHSEQAKAFSKDFEKLAILLAQHGFQGYRNDKQELVFEKQDSIHSLLMATREEFALLGTRSFAALELSNLEQRILAENKIDTQIHTELCKWKDEYNAAQVSIHPGAKQSMPKCTKSTLWSNCALTLKKMVRGDDARVIRWGLDLQGGKSVQIELRDAAGALVTNDVDLKQGINELYNRVNKMGVSEVAIRQHGNTIVLDFPGSQILSASELITASTMHFHVVNEKFSSPSSPYYVNTQRFLSEVWNEAIVTNKQDAMSLNEIAYRHLMADNKTDAAAQLYENGLRLQDPNVPLISSQLNSAVSKIAFIRGEKWFGQAHPLMIVFHHFALAGKDLDRVHPIYDPQRGNSLSFEVKPAARDTLFAWTSMYSKEKVQGTDLDSYSNGYGWRMAVLLNDSIISAPTLDAVIRDSASISGQFSQREVTQLANDLKAGSLTFTPNILSEKNVSPELGAKDRAQGIWATGFALLLVIGSMIAYYRFAGLIASIAVFFNLLILWGVLQNLGATLSLAGIAGIILTVGMAVDANVLVFERIKEEFALTQNIKFAIFAGYKKAYSAIIDSNVTTIIAALILLNFDAGPIKGFAITLIIGIVSSMFTALFMTRFYFTSWVQNPKNKMLNMANWINAKSIDFLKHTKLAFSIASAIILIGGYLVFAGRATIFGMDFTGGFSLQMELTPQADGQYARSVEQAFAAQGVSAQDVQIKTLSPSNQLRVLFGTSMELPAKPFHKIALEKRIDWVIQTLAAKNLSLTPQSLKSIEKNWTAMSGQMSDSMRNNALLGLLFSLICIFIYISFRFEYKFGAASILCLIHDVLITLGVLGILHAFGAPIQIDLNTVAAIMTIVGYSLNDTIIVFDRIREEMSLHRNRSLIRVVNSALNATLSRTSITSGTTLLVLLALVILGGSSIFSFALVMTIGVFFGTLSSWYIAAPLMLYFHKKETERVEITIEG